MFAAARMLEPSGTGPTKSATLTDVRFRRLLGEDQWGRLPLEVRRRFSKRLGPGDSVVYRGRVLETRLSLLGWALARLLAIAGAPLPLERSEGGEAAIVTVTEDGRSGGQVWSRSYVRNGRFPQTIHSRKSFTGPTGLQEEVGAGVGMSLVLRAADDRLEFISERYFVTVASRRLRLPRLLEPGRLIVTHREVTADRFEFSLDLTHPLFGRLVHQRAEFTDPERS